MYSAHVESNGTILTRLCPIFVQIKGNSDWVKEVSDLGLRAGKLMYCKEEEVDASRHYKDFLRLIRSIKPESARYYCFRNATYDSLSIIYCDAA